VLRAAAAHDIECFSDVPCCAHTVHKFSYIEEASDGGTWRAKDQQDSLDWVLKLAFPDMIREPSIAKQTKVYKPDFGIASVETAIEVKFLGKGSAVGTVLGQLYEDMRGYNEAPGYTLFLGLIYMTGHLVSQEMPKPPNPMCLRTGASGW
jgi:hypothetical protein